MDAADVDAADVDASLEIPRWAYRELVDEGRVFRETFPVRFDEAGPDKAATMVTVASMVAECACNHAQHLWGLGQSMPAGMLAENLAWVCTRLHLVVREYPRWGEQVEVKTWFEAQGRVAARRDWTLTSAGNGEAIAEDAAPIGVATSQWVAFNVEKRKMARIPASVVEEFKESANVGSPVMGDAYAVVKLPDIRGVEKGVNEFGGIAVRRRDLDMNGHVNNVVYTEWILEAVPVQLWGTHRLAELELEFRSECNYGDTVDAICCDEAGVAEEADEDEAPAEDGKTRMVHMLLKHGVEGKDAEVIRARTVWEPKEA